MNTPSRWKRNCPICGKELYYSSEYHLKRAIINQSPCAHCAQIKSVEPRFWSKVNRKSPNECWLWIGSKRDGYGRMRVGGVGVNAQRVSWELHNGPIPDGMFVCHKCDNPPCVNPLHLFLGTNKDNMIDMVKKGRGIQPDNTGIKHGMHKLTEMDVSYIKTSKLGGTECAIKFNVSPSAICDIRHNRTWKHITKSSSDNALN